MSNDTFLNSFPSNRLEGLTMIYLQQQDLSKLSPEELVDKYQKTYSRIKDQFAVNREKARNNY